MKKCDLIRGKRVKIGKNVEIFGHCELGDGCQVLGSCKLVDCEIGAGTVVENSTISGSKIGEDCLIGPYANIRTGCVVSSNCRIGAFVELKHAKIGAGCKIAHLAYVGDAVLGEHVNVGCGVVFANYDGKKKSRSQIGDNVFIGCNVNIVAPVKVANRTYICAGTTVTKDTEEDDFVIGRARQENKKRQKTEQKNS